MGLRTYHVAGPVSVQFGSTTLGRLESGAVIRMETYFTPIQDDSSGGVPATQIFTGKRAFVELSVSDILSAKNLFPGTTTNPPEIGDFSNTDGTVGPGCLLSAVAKTLTITERVQSYTWHANKAWIIDPSNFNLASSREVVAPLTIIVVPDDDGILFETIPSYVAT